PSAATASSDLAERPNRTRRLEPRRHEVKALQGRRYLHEILRFDRYLTRPPRRAQPRCDIGGLERVTLPDRRRGIRASRERLSLVENRGQQLAECHPLRRPHAVGHAQYERRPRRPALP